jgi:hypothetical protein
MCAAFMWLNKKKKKKKKKKAEITLRNFWVPYKAKNF